MFFKFLGISFLLLCWFSLYPLEGQSQSVLSKHSFAIELDSKNSKLEHELSSVELLHLGSVSQDPAVVCKGKVIFENILSASLSYVKLAKTSINAVNEKGDVLPLFLKGSIGSQPLNNEFVHPNFETNSKEVSFVIYGFLVPVQTGTISRSSLPASNSFAPGVYEFAKDLKIIVEFAKPKI